MVTKSVVAFLDWVTPQSIPCAVATHADSLPGGSPQDHNAWLIHAPEHDWFVAIFEGPEDASKTIPTGVHRVESWLPNRELQTSLKKILTESGQSATQLADRITIVQRGWREIALCVPCDGIHNVEGLLQHESAPPSIVIDDWRDQLQCLRPSPCIPTPRNTFVDEDGILIPIDGAVSTWSRENALRTCAIANHTNSAPWPWEANDRNVTAESASLKWLLAPQDSSESTKLPARADRNRGPLLLRFHSLKKNRRTRRLVTSLSIASIALFSMIGFWLSRSQVPHQSRTASTSPIVSATTPEDDTPEKTVVDDIDLDAELAISPQLIAPDESVSIDSLLSELNPSNHASFSLQTTPTSIIQDVLSKTKVAQSDSSDTLQIRQADISTAESNAEESSLNEEKSSPSKRVLKLSTPFVRETLVIPTGDAPKQYRIRVSLQVSKKLVVQPDEAIAIDANNKATFKIGIEDEDPEIVVEIITKPAIKWQVLVKVYLRDPTHGLLIPIGPRDAQLVGNRFLDYHHWLSLSIASLQNAKSNRPRNSRTDFLSEIIRLERQQRALDKTIEQWKDVEKLSRLFFDDNELSLALELESSVSR